MLSLGVAFVVPKASPLKASFPMFKENTTLEKITKSLQRDFHMAVAWWMDTGIYAKMLSDVLLLIDSRREVERVKKFRGSDKPLSAAHLLACFLFLGVGLTLSATALACEVLSCRGGVKNTVIQPQGRSKRIRINEYVP